MSERKRFYWLKLKEDFFGDKRIKKLRKIAGGDTYTIIYLKMQLESLKNNGVLIFEGVEKTFAEEIALVIDEDIENVKVTIAFLLDNNLLVECKENEFALPETQELIGTETNWAIQKRNQRQVDIVHQVSTNCPRDIDIDKDIDIDIEIDKDKEKKENKKEKNIIPPKLEWVENYCLERNNNIDPQAFFDFYEGKGWMIGKNKMKDWQAAIRTWEKNRQSNTNNKSNDLRYVDTSLMPDTTDDEFPF